MKDTLAGNHRCDGRPRHREISHADHVDKRAWALLPPMSEWGMWDRSEPERQDKKFGRPAGHLGSQYGSGRRPDVLEKCIDGFRKFAKRSERTLKRFLGRGHRRLKGADRRQRAVIALDLDRT